MTKVLEDSITEGFGGFMKPQIDLNKKKIEKTRRKKLGCPAPAHGLSEKPRALLLPIHRESH
jgi:hypothetical protein